MSDSALSAKTGEFKNLPRIKHDSKLEGDEKTARREHSYTCPSTVHPTSISGERTVKKAIPSKQTQCHQEVRLTMPEQLSFDGAARSGMAGNTRLQAHKIEIM